MQAGFVSPLLTLRAEVFAAVAIIGGKVLFPRLLPVATDHVRFIIVGTMVIIAIAWIVKYTLLDD